MSDPDPTSAPADEPAVFFEAPESFDAAAVWDQEVESADTTVTFILTLARALHIYGTPAHVLEGVVYELGAGLGEVVHIFATPTSLLVALGPLGQQRVHMLRVEPGEVNLHKLSSLDVIADQVHKRELSVSEASARIESVVAEPADRYPIAWSLAFALTSGMSAVFFGGRTAEFTVATLIGGIVAILWRLGTRSSRLVRMLEPVSALIATLIVASVAYAGVAISPYITIIAGLIVLLPGFSLTVAMSELATKNSMAGTARLSAALMTAVMLAFGVVVGERIALDVGMPLTRLDRAPPGLLILTGALIASGIGFGVIFRASAHDVPVCVAGGLLGFLGASAGALALGANFGVFVGALVVGITSNAWARWRDRPATILQVPGIMLLVPGSFGFRSMSAFMSSDVVAGFGTFFAMFVIAISLVAGLLASNLIVRPRGYM